jgi:hypothetical protein
MSRRPAYWLIRLRLSLLRLTAWGIYGRGPKWIAYASWAAYRLTGGQV